MPPAICRSFGGLEILMGAIKGGADMAEKYPINIRVNED
jgi:hypothetical protein